MPNRLARESSPYLLQHASNPVDWYPWGEEAFERARTDNKPVLLSIGYSACHWCHVMAHESFENESIASLMNENFVNIKVDREERPDIDHIYMQAVQAMTGGGGWPLTVFLTPGGRPFYGGTYFPPEDRQNFPGFPKVLRTVADAYRNQRAAIEQTTGQIDRLFAGLMEAPAASRALTENILQQAYSSLAQYFDHRNGGFGGAPKFPQPLTLEFLLRYYTRFKEKFALEMADTTLTAMAGGGIYDQIGGGFHRYATDTEWLYPHFEKMLYDNALLSRTYLHAYQIGGKQLFASIAEETLDYMLREMRSSDGGFYCSQDADSEGQEGRYYLWSTDEVRDLLGNVQAQKVEDYFGLRAEGNFEGRSILHVQGRIEKPELTEVKKALLAARERRVKPGRDEKVLASWNGLALASLSEAALILKRPDYLEAAAANGAFILENMVHDGKLKHTFKDGQAGVDGFLDDYALVIDGMLLLHQSTLEAKWLKAAVELAEKMVSLFSNDRRGLLFDTEAGQKLLIMRPRNDYDGALPCGASGATLVLLKIALLTGDGQFSEIARKQMESAAANMGQSPLGYSQWLSDLDFYLSSPRQIVLIGPGSDPQTLLLADTVGSYWLPNKVVAALDPENPGSMERLSIFEERKMVGGRPTAYICQNFTCRAPITDAGEMQKTLEDG